MPQQHQPCQAEAEGNTASLQADRDTYPLHITLHLDDDQNVKCIDSKKDTNKKEIFQSDSATPTATLTSPSPPPPLQEEISPDIQNSFRRDGFYVFHNVFDRSTVERLNYRLEEVLRGRYDRGIKPDKTPKLIKSELAKKEQHQCEDGIPLSQCTCDNKSEHGCVGAGLEKIGIEKIGIKSSNENEVEHNHGTNIAATSAEPNHKDTEGHNKTKKKNNRKKKTASTVGPLGYSGNTQNVRVLQVINVHKSDQLFRALATSEHLGKLVSELAGWECGARLAQDQVWAKPPGAPPLVFHRDSPYFMFTPSDVVTVWVALDDMDEELGPLSYVKGSHRWGDGRVGSANKFFQSDGGKSLLYSAAEREGIEDVSQLEFVSMAGLKAGGISVHDGRTWHGSGKNESRDRPRRGLGLHFVPANVRFTADARRSSLWRKYVPDEKNTNNVGSIELPGDDFPVTWERGGGRKQNDEEFFDK